MARGCQASPEVIVRAIRVRLWEAGAIGPDQEMVFEVVVGEVLKR